jgi:hypothetical protein
MIVSNPEDCMVAFQNNGGTSNVQTCGRHPRARGKY